MPQTRPAPDWQCLNSRAPFQGRDSQGYTTFQDRIWILGGWFTPDVPNPRDVWASKDGVDWECMNPEAPWLHSDLPVCLDFHNKLWIMGGRRLPGKENSNAVWSSPDGREWSLVCEAAGWCPRVGPAHAVFQDKMWVLGGSEDFYGDFGDNLHNDVWCSEDGIQWECILEEAPWPARSHHRAQVFQDKLWVLAGGARFPDPFTRNDVWFTEDGKNWQQVDPNPPWGPRNWASTAVYRDHLFVLAGWTPETVNYGDVWCSPDGKEWTQLKSDTIWTPRHAQALYTHRDQLILAAGHARPVNSEVWSLQLPEDFFK